MRTILFITLVIAAAFCRAEDDGQYHPERYGADDGQYHPQVKYYQAPVYYNAFSTVSPLSYHPVYYKAATPYYQPVQQLLTPLVTYGDHSGINHSSYATATSVDSVTIRPAVYSTVAPIVYSSTPKPLSLVNQAPVVYTSTPKPLSLVAQQVLARQYSGEQNAGILRQSNDLDATSYKYNYQTGNGIAAEEAGNVAAGGGTKASGFYEYVGDDGIKYRVDYTADENGFRPRGAHIPV